MQITLWRRAPARARALTGSAAGRPLLAAASVLLLLGAVLVAAVPAPAQGPARLDLVTALAEEAEGKIPTGITWSPDGGAIAYLWGNGGEQAVWIQPVDGPPRRLATGADLDDAAPAIDAAHWVPGGGELLVEAGGDLFLVAVEDGAGRRLTDTSAAEENPRLAPAGRRATFVRDGDLWLIDLATGDERALTTDGDGETVVNGKTDWVYWEEIWDRTTEGTWWSPDGERILFYRFDDSAVGRYPLVTDELPYPRVTWQRFPVAGSRNPEVKLGVVDSAGGEPVWLATDDPETETYLARAAWRPDGAVSVQRLDREQSRLELLRCDPADGGCRVVLTETWPTWVNLSTDLTFLDGGGFLWTSERDGWRALYLYDEAGDGPRRVSPAGIAVTSLDGVVGDGDGQAVLYTGHPTGELGALRRTVYRQALDGSAPVALSQDGWSSARVAPRGGRWVETRSDASTPQSAAIRAADGRTLASLPARAPAGYDPELLPRWRFFTLPGPEGARLPAALLEPAGREPGRRYPAIMYHYGGPGSQVVADRWGRRSRDLWHRAMAERGYAVLMVDNQASSYFGKRGEDRAHRLFGPTNLAAQRAGVDYLAGLGWVDPARIGLWGWSGGGTHTLLAMFNSPGTWRAGVAGAPVTDWRLYDTIWTERYLDHPDGNPDGYRESSPVTWAPKLEDALLVVHGTADDNVHPQNTERLSRALVDAGRPFEQAIHPGQKHGFIGADRKHFFLKMTEFFDRHLRQPAAAAEAAGGAAE